MDNTDEKNNELTGLPASDNGDSSAPAEEAKPSFDLSVEPKKEEEVTGAAPIMTDAPSVEKVEPIKLDVNPEPTEKKTEPVNIEPPKMEEKAELQISAPEQKKDEEIKVAENINPIPPAPTIEEEQPKAAMPDSPEKADTAVNNPPLPENGNPPLPMAEGMPRAEKKSHIGLYVGAAVFVLLLGGGAYAYMTNLFGFLDSSSEVISLNSEPEQSSESESEDELNAAADTMMEDETMESDDIDEGLPPVTEDMMLMDETAPEDTMSDESMNDEMMMEDSTVVSEPEVSDEPPKVRRASSTSTPETEDAMTENVDETIAMGDVIDCGEDLNCFLEAADSCRLATVSHNVLGVDGIQSITGGDTETCKLLTSAAGYQQECTFQHDDLIDVLSRWMIGEYSTDDYNNADCTVL